MAGVTFFLAAVVGVAPSADSAVSFNRDIRPILAENCFPCHGPDQKHREADLRLDVRDTAIEMAAIVTGDADASELVRRVESVDEGEQMPPAESRKRLTDQQKQLLRRWVAEGARYEKHWAYEPPVKAAVPEGAQPVDYFVERRLAERGLAPAAEADRRTLARRLSLDLLGLPPRPEEVDAFVDDPAPDAYERMVERLLASPHFGERMALAWLDLVRFADTIGYHSDNPQTVWPYRDYVIRSFNDNKPFDQFTLEQLAGDLLPESTQDQRVGSCFNRLLLTTQEGGAQPKDYEQRMLADRVRAVGTVWLGQTFGCCQCHDHKFDPMTAQDFYSLGAFFADIEEPIIGLREPGMLLATAEQTAELERLKQSARTLKQELDATLPELPELKAQAAAAETAAAGYEGAIPRCMVSTAAAPRTVRILPRGNWMDESGPVVEPALPHFLPQAAAEPGRRLTRLDLARWIVSRENPLPARVFVNRSWKQFFGIGLSKSLDDLGSQGEWPANPELLDWLAVEFMDSGWDVKHLVRLIVNSHAYRQASTAPAELLARDPDNRWLARQSRFRLDAELVRDNALAVSGLLTPTIGGRSVFPYQPDGYWENLNFPERSYVADVGPEQYRRGLYTWRQRTFPHPSLLAFDAPTREECAADRARSNIPQQSLSLLNDPTYVEAARALAARIMREGGADPAGRIRWAWRQALARPPHDDELAVAAQLYEKHRTELAADPAAVEALLHVGQSPIPGDLDSIDLAAWTSVARMILNLHETIVRN